MEARPGWPGLRPSLCTVTQPTKALTGELTNFPLHHRSLTLQTNRGAGKVMEERDRCLGMGGSECEGCMSSSQSLTLLACWCYLHHPG